MSSNLRVLLLLSSFWFCGCGLKIGESPAPEGEVRIEGYSCVNEISRRVGEYFDDRLDEAQVIQFMDCLKKSIGDFSKRVGTQGQTVFIPEDLRTFINKISGPEHPLNPKLLAQFMRIKQTFVGGRVDQITRSDLESALNLLDDIKRAALILRPHVRLFNAQLGTKIPASQIARELDKASSAMEEVSKIFVTSLKETQSSYSLSDFETFLEEFRLFIDWYEVYPDAISTKSWAGLLMSAKEIATGSESRVIRPMEWESYVNILKSCYILYLKTKYGVWNQSLLSGVGLKNFIHVVSESIKNVTSVVSARADRRIRTDELKRWVLAMGQMGWIPFGLNADTAFSGLKLLSSKIFGLSDTFEGVDVLQLLQMARDFEEWAAVQLYVSERYGQDVPRMNGPQIFGIHPENLNLTQSQIPSGWKSLDKLMRQRRPLHRTDQRMVFLAPRSQLATFGVSADFYNVSMTHLYASILKLVYRAYGRTVGGDLRLSSANLQSFYEDFYKLGVGLKWLDPRSNTAGKRAYIEGNLFTYAANGFATEYDLDISEGIDLITYLLSGGILTQRLYESLADHCEKGSELDVHGKAKLKRSCVEDFMPDVLLKNLEFAPHLEAWFKSRSLHDQDVYSLLLLNAGFSNKFSTKEWVETPELSTLSVIIFYTESVLTRFDQDGDGKLNSKEVTVAFPLFKDFIRNLSKQSGSGEDMDEATVRAVFDFILIYKRLPLTSAPGDWFRTWDEYWIGWNAGTPVGDIDADRMHLTEAFSAIINRLLNPN